jgi:hypothetical protein
MTGSAVGSGPTFTDNLSNTLTLGPTIAGTPIYSAYYTLPSGVTSITATWTLTKQCGMAVVEYSGVNNVNPSLSGNTASGTSAAPSISLTTEDSNDVIVAGFHTANAFTIGTGTLRASTITSIKTYVADNTSASPGSVTVAGTQTSGTFTAVALELRTSTGIGGTNQLMMLGCGG